MVVRLGLGTLLAALAARVQDLVARVAMVATPLLGTQALPTEGVSRTWEEAYITQHSLQKVGTVDTVIAETLLGVPVVMPEPMSN
jgi:hypothetical protein